MSKLIDKIKEIFGSLKYYASAITECAFCPYYSRCNAEVAEPEDNPDGSCKQRRIYESNI